MKSYPSIDGPFKAPKEPCYAFVKYDGSNLRFEWSPKRSWYKFGTRKTMIDDSHFVYGSAITLFLDKYGDDLERAFKTEKSFHGVQSVVVYAEWFGANSLAGAHKPWEPKDIVVFDVNLHKKGLLSPKEFIDIFGHLNIAEVVWQGTLDDDFVQSVREETIDVESKYPIRAVVPEGVVCKGSSRHNLWMCKIKTERYKDALKQVHDRDWERYWE